MLIVNKRLDQIRIEGNLRLAVMVKAAEEQEKKLHAYATMAPKQQGLM